MKQMCQWLCVYKCFKCVACNNCTLYVAAPPCVNRIPRTWSHFYQYYFFDSFVSFWLWLLLMFNQCVLLCLLSLYVLFDCHVPRLFPSQMRLDPIKRPITPQARMKKKKRPSLVQMMGIRQASPRTKAGAKWLSKIKKGEQCMYRYLTSEWPPFPPFVTYKRERTSLHAQRW